MLRITAVILTTALLLFGCSTQEPGKVDESIIKPADVSEVGGWGVAASVTNLKHLYFAAQPDVAGISAAEKAGIDVVINLRGASEFDDDAIVAMSKELGLDYQRVPISRDSDTFDQAQIDQISEIVRANHDKKILLHCSSSNRVAAWLAIHLAQDHTMSVEDSLAIAERAGLTRDSLKGRVRTYLGDQSE